MKNLSLIKFLSVKNIQLTALRQDIFAILYAKSKPMGAYEILNELRKNKPTAEPPTVYRVLDYLVDAKLVHRIESQNTYVCCSHQPEQKKEHKTILLICKNCERGIEYEDKPVFQTLKKFATKNTIELDDVVIELKGLCKECVR